MKPRESDKRAAVRVCVCVSAESVAPVGLSVSQPTIEATCWRFGV